MSTLSLLDGMISRAELERELNVVSRTISRYESQPDGLPSLTIGGRKMYRVESVRKWLERRERHPNRRRKTV
jgi:hypothetical protein